MSKKLMFILLMSGVILSPMVAYALDEEGTPQTSISRPIPSGPSASGLTQEDKNLIMEHANRAAARRGLSMMPPSLLDWQSGTPEGVQRLKERADLIREYGDRIQFDARGNPSSVVPSFLVPPIR